MGWRPGHLGGSQRMLTGERGCRDCTSRSHGTSCVCGAARGAARGPRAAHRWPTSTQMASRAASPKGWIVAGYAMMQTMKQSSVCVPTLIVDGRRIGGADPTSMAPDVERTRVCASAPAHIFCTTTRGHEWRSAEWQEQGHAVLAARMVSHEYYGHLRRADAPCHRVKYGAPPRGSRDLIRDIRSAAAASIVI